LTFSSSAFIDLCVDPGVQVVVSDDHLGLGFHKRLPDIDLKHALDDRDYEVETWVRVAVVFAEALR
jgi:hypothetical protein